MKIKIRVLKRIEKTTNTRQFDGLKLLVEVTWQIEKAALPKQYFTVSKTVRLKVD
jgi:hypothetical protein